MQQVDGFTRLVKTLHFAKYNLFPFKPRMLLRHLRARILANLLRRPGFRVIDLALSYECNLSCIHCSAMTMKNEAPRLTLSDYHRIVEEAAELDVLSWNLTGGEPLLVPWLGELITTLKPDRSYISIQTNAILLTQEKARWLADMGVNCITTSIDDIDPATHNSFRGAEEAFALTVAGIRSARKVGLGVLVGMTVTHQNLRSREVSRLIEFINEEGAIALFNLAVPCGKWEKNYDVVLRGDDRAFLVELMRKYHRTTTDHEVALNRMGCPAGVEKAYITPFGDVLPCPFIHVSFGNLHARSLPAVMADMRTVGYFNQAQPLCLAAEDQEFHKQVFERIAALDVQRPVPAADIFGGADTRSR